MSARTEALPCGSGHISRNVWSPLPYGLDGQDGGAWETFAALGGRPICLLLSRRSGREEYEFGAAEAGPVAEVVAGAFATAADAAEGLVRVCGLLPGVRSRCRASGVMVSTRSEPGSEAEVGGAGNCCLLAGSRGFLVRCMPSLWADG